MSHKLTMDQIQQARIRMEGEHAIKRKIKDKIMKHMSVTAAIPVMDIDDELTRVKAQRDALLKACELVLSRWTFGNHQEHTHTWHDMADCKAVITAAISMSKHAH